MLSESARALLADARAKRSEWIAQQIADKLDAAACEDLEKGVAALRKLL